MTARSPTWTVHPGHLPGAGEPGLLDNTIVINPITVRPYDHDCYFDHHGLYDNTLRVPLIIRYPKNVLAGGACPATLT